MPKQKMFVCKFPKKMLSPSYNILRLHRIEGNSVNLDEVAHNEPPHQDLRCLQIQLFSSPVLKELRDLSSSLSERGRKQ